MQGIADQKDAANHYGEQNGCMLKECYNTMQMLNNKLKKLKSFNKQFLAANVNGGLGKTKVKESEHTHEESDENMLDDSFETDSFGEFIAKFKAGNSKCVSSGSKTRKQEKLWHAAHKNIRYP